MMERFAKIALLSVIAGLGAVGVQSALLIAEGFWTPFTVTGLWHDIAGKAPPFGNLVTDLLDHSIGVQLAAGGLLLLLGSIVLEDIALNRRKNRRPRNRGAAKL
jgi:hypothetical protein